MVFVTRTLPQKVKPEENLGSGTKEITQEKKKKVLIDKSKCEILKWHDSVSI